MYAVTVFAADDSDTEETIEAHPALWLTPGRKRCRWPNVNVSEAIRKSASPTDMWTTHGVKKVLVFCGEYNMYIVYITKISSQDGGMDDTMMSVYM